MQKKITLAKGKGFRVESGHPWVYDNEIASAEGNPNSNDIVDVFNFKNVFLGKGFYSPSSKIRVRICSRIENDVIDKKFFRTRLLGCRKYRQQLGLTNNYRLVFGEGDFLPSLVIDKFNDVYVIQTLSAGMDHFKKMIADILMEDFGAKGVYERNDAPVRQLENLEQIQGFLSDPFETKMIINENGVQFELDIAQGQKTGFFLDQKENRNLIEPFVKGANVLDCFSYTGSFSLFAAKFGASSVLGLDISGEALLQAKRNAELNQIKTCSWIEANAFDVLPVWAKEQKQFDTVILDPPAFTKTRSNIHSAVRGYREINLRGMKIVKPGGFLITFSCSHFMMSDLFLKTIKDAASDAGKTIRQVSWLSQAKDHPILWPVEETSYLKGLILQVI